MTDPLERAVDRAAHKAELNRLRAALAEAEQERDALNRECIAGNAINAQIIKAEQLSRHRAERAEADLAAAREVISDLVHLAWTKTPTKILGISPDEFKKLPQIEKARAFLERTATASVTPPNSL